MAADDAQVKAMDHIPPKQRSWLMAQVRSKDTSVELKVRRAAHSLGLRFRLHRSDLPGTPDLVFPKHRLVVFVHGCFWHRHAGCRRASLPKTRVEFWKKKFENNVKRDRRVSEELTQGGWRVEIIWECEVEKKEFLTRRLLDIFHLDMP